MNIPENASKEQLDQLRKIWKKRNMGIIIQRKR